MAVEKEGLPERHQSILRSKKKERWKEGKKKGGGKVGRVGGNKKELGERKVRYSGAAANTTSYFMLHTSSGADPSINRRKRRSKMTQEKSPGETEIVR